VASSSDSSYIIRQTSLHASVVFERRFLMLFRIVSFHPSADHSVKPSCVTYIQASTHFNAKTVAGTYLAVPREEVLLDLFEGTPGSAEVVIDERTGAPVARKSGMLPAVMSKVA
jgi:hypothetical protein